MSIRVVFVALLTFWALPVAASLPLASDPANPDPLQRSAKAEPSSEPKIQLAKRGGIRIFGGGSGSSSSGPSLPGGKTVGRSSRGNSELSATLARIGARILIYGWTQTLLLVLSVAGLLYAAINFIRFILRGLFLRYRTGTVTETRMTKEGEFIPIVVFQDSQGRFRKLAAPFTIDEDPRGFDAEVEVYGSSARVITERRSFVRGLSAIILPILVASGLFFISVATSGGG